MTTRPRGTNQIDYAPVTRERWPDLEMLFQASASEELGNPSRCWCMEWRLKEHSQWERQARAGGEENRHGMRAFVESGNVPGILAYADGQPVAWCSVAPRSSLLGLHEASSFRNPQRADVWSIICFYVRETHRGQGLIKGLTRAAVRHAVEQGAMIVEGYPMTPEAFGDGAGGSVPIFEDAGFIEVARVSDQQRVVRYFVEVQQY